MKLNKLLIMVIQLLNFCRCHKISVDQEENAELQKITSDTLNRILEGIDIHLKFRHDNVMNVINNMENRVKLEMDSLQKVEL